MAMTPKQLQKKLEVLARRFDRLSDSLRDNKAEVRFLRTLVENVTDVPSKIPTDEA